MKEFMIVSQNSWLRGPNMVGITAAKKELRAVVSAVRRSNKRRTWAYWSEDKMSCIITLGPDLHYSPLWERYSLIEV